MVAMSGLPTLKSMVSGEYAIPAQVEGKVVPPFVAAGDPLSHQ